MKDEPNDLMREICVHVSNGGSIIDLSELWGIAFGHLIGWIRDDKTRDIDYQQSLSDREEFVRQGLLREFKRLSMFDARKLYRDDGTMKAPDEWDDDVASMVQSFEQEELYDGVGKERMEVGKIKKVKLWSKERALQMLAKNMGMLIERIDHSGKVTLEDLINESREEDEQ